jgi:hypothetical protein
LVIAFWGGGEYTTYMAINGVDIRQAELMCDKHNCPAAGAQEVELFEQDFKFCMHHFNELEPLFVGMLDTDHVLVDA